MRSSRRRSRVAVDLGTLAEVLGVLDCERMELKDAQDLDSRG
jgi:hypothetical protein